VSRASSLTFVALLVLAGALLTGTDLRAKELSVKRQFNHDEAVSYIAATGHQDQYAWATGGVGAGAPKGGLTDRWVPAADWKRLMEPGNFWDFGAVSSGLAHTDTHPPLYFWILHIWVAVAGVHLKDGIAINILITLATGVVLFFLARRLLKNPLEAALVVLVWDVSPPMLATSILARQYDLFAFFVALFALLVVRAADLELPFRRRDFAALAVVTAAGVLTHYQFVVVVAAGVAYATIFLVRKDRGRLLGVAGSFVAGLPIFLIAAPHFYLSVRRQAELQASGIALSALWVRVHGVASGLYPWFGLAASDLRAAPGFAAAATRPLWGPLASGAAAAALGAALLCACAALAIALALPRSRAGTRAYLGRIDTTGVVPALVLLGGMAAGVFGMYLSFRSPSYAMHDRYLAPLWVLLAFVPVLLARLLIGRSRYVVVALFVALVMLPASLGRLHTLRNSSPNPGPTLQAAGRIVIDGPNRGDASRLLFWIPDKTPVFLAWQSQLRQHPGAWLPELRPRDLYLTLRFYGGNSPASLAAVERLIGTRFALRARHDGLRGVGRMFVLSDKTTSSAGTRRSAGVG
jgi:hypothetical protein